MFTSIVLRAMLRRREMTRLLPLRMIFDASRAATDVTSLHWGGRRRRVLIRLY